MSGGRIRVTDCFTAFCTGFTNVTAKTIATTRSWNPVDIMKDFFWRPYRPQMSFTATGLEVTSSGGSFGGLMNSLTFRTKDRYQGSSTSETRSRDKWSSALEKLFGC